jgi:hypothetical protein
MLQLILLRCFFCGLSLAEESQNENMVTNLPHPLKLRELGVWGVGVCNWRRTRIGENYKLSALVRKEPSQWNDWLPHLSCERSCPLVQQTNSVAEEKKSWEITRNPMIGRKTPDVGLTARMYAPYPVPLDVRRPLKDQWSRSGVATMERAHWLPIPDGSCSTRQGQLEGCFLIQVQYNTISGMCYRATSSVVK